MKLVTAVIKPFKLEEVRDALALRPDTPVVRVDARSVESGTATLIALVEHALRRDGGAPGRGRSVAGFRPLASASGIN